MKKIVKSAVELLDARKSAMVEEVQASFATISVPSGQTSIPQNIQGTKTSAKTAYLSIGGGAVLLIAGANMENGKTLPLALGLGAIVFGAFKLFQGKQRQMPAMTNSTESDISLLIGKINARYNDLYNSILNEWDDGLNDIKEKVSKEINSLSLETEKRSKATNIIRSRSVIELSTLDLLDELNRLGRNGDTNGLRQHIGKANTVFMSAIEQAYSKQVETYEKLLSIS